MKKLFQLTLINILILASFYLNAQSQDAFNFQAVIRNDSGTVLENKDIKVLFEILESNPNGQVVFLQESEVTTNPYGLISAEIGNEEVMEGDFSNIAWSENSYFIRISVDFEASGNFEEIGVSQLLSVPYAMYAKSSGNSYWEKSEEGIYNNTDNISIGSDSASNLFSISLPETGDQKDKGFSLSRNEGHLDLLNGTLYDGHFQARISGKSTHQDSPGLIIAATPSVDEVSKNGILLRAGEEQALENANALTIQNFEQSLITIKADGKTGFGTENPNYQVDVNGTLNASNILINGETVNSSRWDSTQEDISFNTGSVGIGTNTPNNLLNISLAETGSQKDKGFSLSRNEGHLDLLNGTLYDGHFQARISGKSTHQDSPGLIIAATPSVDEVSKNGILLRAGEEQALENANALTIQNFEQSLITIKADGKTGFGTENPNYQVDVNGTLNASNILINGETVNSSRWDSTQEDISFNTGSVGIGTNTPNNLLNISLAETGSQKDKGFSLSRNEGHLDLLNGTLYDGHFQARISGKSTHQDSPGLIIAATPSVDEVSKNGILLRAGEEQALENANALTIQNFEQSLITVKADGKTGFGTENPNYQVDVNGTLNASNILINGETVNSSRWDSTQEDISFNTGNVGIGTSDPTNLLSITGAKDGDERTMFAINNLNSSTNNSAALEIKAGSNTNSTTLRMHADNYSYSWWAKHGQLKTQGEGLIIEATKDDGSGGNIVFVNGQTGITNIEKTVNMQINSDGHVGIGTTAPKSKLQVTNGDIYIEDAASGVIMTSPDGNCWRMTVDNSGNPQFTSTTCPQ